MRLKKQAIKRAFKNCHCLHYFCHTIYILFNKILPLHLLWERRGRVERKRERRMGSGIKPKREKEENQLWEHVLLPSKHLVKVIANRHFCFIKLVCWHIMCVCACVCGERDVVGLEISLQVTDFAQMSPWKWNDYLQMYFVRGGMVWSPQSYKRWPIK